MLFNEPKLLKCWEGQPQIAETISFSALQRAEIAEIVPALRAAAHPSRFSALQRAEIAEIRRLAPARRMRRAVSVLFNEPKLLKFNS